MADKKFATGVIKEPHENDLICGRGGKVNAHPGNRRFRAWVNERKEAYTRAHAKGEKNAIAQSILHKLVSQNPPGRVLHFDDKTGIYKEVSVKKAMSKTTQALREGAPELRKKNGLPPPKELSKAKQASLSMSSAEDYHNPSVGDRPKVVHIKAPGFLENDAEHEYDASSSSSGSVDSGRVSMKGSYHKHATGVGVVGGSSRKHDHFSHPPTSDDFDQDHDYAGFGKKKKPRIVGAASSDEDSSTKRDSSVASPPISDSASLLYALATTCAKQVPSMESPPASGQEDAPSEQRLVTPETDRGSSRRLWTDQHQHSGAAAASIGTSYPSCTSLTSSAALTASDSLRLEKEKTVQSFLITNLPCIYMDDVRDYTKRLVDDGFDCLKMLTEQLEEDDLDFMKKAHKRALLQVIRKET